MTQTPPRLPWPLPPRPWPSPPSDATARMRCSGDLLAPPPAPVLLWRAAAATYPRVAPAFDLPPRCSGERLALDLPPCGSGERRVLHLCGNGGYIVYERTRCWNRCRWKLQSANHSKREREKGGCEWRGGELQTLPKSATTSLLGSFNRRRRNLGTGHHARESWNCRRKKLQPLCGKASTMEKLQWASEKSFNGRRPAATGDEDGDRRPETRTATGGNEDGNRRPAARSAAGGELLMLQGSPSPIAMTRPRRCRLAHRRRDQSRERRRPVSGAAKRSGTVEGG